MSANIQANCEMINERFELVFKKVNTAIMHPALSIVSLSLRMKLSRSAFGIRCLFAYYTRTA